MAAFRRVIGVVQAEADDLARVLDRRMEFQLGEGSSVLGPRLGRDGGGAIEGARPRAEEPQKVIRKAGVSRLEVHDFVADAKAERRAALLVE